MKLDQAFIWVYVASFVVWTIFACAWAYLWDAPRQVESSQPRAPWIQLGIMTIATILIALADSKENNCILQFLDRTNSCSLAAMRLAAQTKYAMIGILLLSLSLALLIGLRRELRSRAIKKLKAGELTTSPAGGSFQDLVNAEHRGILRARDATSGRVGDKETGKVGDKQISETETTSIVASEEPKVIHSRVDYVGLALSGGGIRSATFNLGLLQGLHRFDLLRQKYPLPGTLNHASERNHASGGINVEHEC